MNRNQLKEALSDLLLGLGIYPNGRTESTIDIIVDKYIPEKVEKVEKVKKPKVIKHTYLGRIKLDEDELQEFLDEPEYWLRDCNMPTFSFDKGESPDAVEGEEMFIRLNDDLYSFTIHEGDCVEASWSGSIYETDVKNVRLIPESEYENYNLVKIKGTLYGYDY